MQIIWNTSTRAELLKFVDKQRDSQGPDGSFDLKDLHSFTYEALSKELFVGNVYLRVYNDQPDYETSEPEVFCVALVDFISCLVRSDAAVGTDTPSTTGTSEFENDTINGPHNEEQLSNDDSTPSDVKQMKKEENELVNKFRFALTALQVHIGIICPVEYGDLMFDICYSFFRIS